MINFISFASRHRAVNSLKHTKTFSTSTTCLRIEWRKVMGKQDANLKVVQEIRKKRREQVAKDVPSTVYFQILGNGAQGGPKSVFMFTDHNRYLFNCGESSQKIYTESTVSKSLGQLTNIFITRKNWENLGGILGKKFEKHLAFMV